MLFSTVIKFKIFTKYLVQELSRAQALIIAHFHTFAAILSIDAGDVTKQRLGLIPRLAIIRLPPP